MITHKTLSRRRRPHILKRLDQLQALRSPTRVQLTEAMEHLGDCSVRDLADYLGRPPEALQYHIRKLLAVNLLQATGKRRIRCRMETVYRLAGRYLQIDHENHSPEYMRALGEVYSAAIRHADRSLTESLRLQAANSDLHDEPAGLVQSISRLSRRNVTRVRRMIRELTEFVAANRCARDGEALLLTVIYSPDTKGQP